MKKVNKPYLFILLGIVILVYACTKDKLEQPVINTTVSFKSDIYPVFASSTGHCGTSSCHPDQFSPPQFASLDSCYTTLMRDTSIYVDGYHYINTSHPDSSYLYIKLTSSSPPHGERMPQGGPYLSSEFTAKVLKWIEQGAPNN